MSDSPDLRSAAHDDFNVAVGRLADALRTLGEATSTSEEAFREAWGAVGRAWMDTTLLLAVLDSAVQVERREADLQEARRRAAERQREENG